MMPQECYSFTMQAQMHYTMKPTKPKALKYKDPFIYILENAKTTGTGNIDQ